MADTTLVVKDRNTINCTGCDEPCDNCGHVLCAKLCPGSTTNGNYFTCENGCDKSGCSNCIGEDNFLECEYCSAYSCLKCARKRTKPQFSCAKIAEDDTSPKQYFVCQTDDCGFAICESCWFHEFEGENETLAECDRCSKIVCENCKPSFMSGFKSVLPGCYACPRSFCEDCLSQNTVVCRKKNCTCEPRCVCDVVCLDCRDERCRRCGSLLSRQEQTSLRLRKKALTREREVRKKSDSSTMKSLSDVARHSQAAAKADRIMLELLAEDELERERTEKKKKKKKKKKEKCSVHNTDLNADLECDKCQTEKKNIREKKERSSSKSKKKQQAASPAMLYENGVAYVAMPNGDRKNIDNGTHQEVIPDVENTPEKQLQSAESQKAMDGLEKASAGDNIEALQNAIATATKYEINTHSATKQLKRLTKAHELRKQLNDAQSEEELCSAIEKGSKAPKRVAGIVKEELSNAQNRLAEIMKAKEPEVVVVEEISSSVSVAANLPAHLELVDNGELLSFGDGKHESSFSPKETVNSFPNSLEASRPESAIWSPGPDNLAWPTELDSGDQQQQSPIGQIGGAGENGLQHWALTDSNHKDIWPSTPVDIPVSSSSISVSGVGGETSRFGFVPRNDPQPGTTFKKTTEEPPNVATLSTEQCVELSKFLQKHGLRQYFAKLVSSGVTLQHLQAMKPQDFFSSTCISLPIPQLKLQRALGFAGKEPYRPESPGSECSVCLNNVADTTLEPCGHACVCWSCYKSYVHNLKVCPICRGEISSAKRAMPT